MTGTPAEVRSHRAPRGPAAANAARLGSGLGVAALVIAATAIGGLIRSYTPDVDTKERPFTVAGVQGGQLSTRTFDVEVLDVRGAKKISRSGRVRESVGLWILVKVRLQARTEPATIGYGALRDGRDRTFRATERIDQPLLQSRQLQPGIPIEGEIAFEVPEDAAAHLTMRLAAPILDQRMDAMAEIPLRIDEAAVGRWRAEAKPLVISDERLAG